MPKLKKGESEVAFLAAYRLLSIRIIISPITIIAIIAAVPMPKTYVSVIGAGVGVGGGVSAGTSSTVMAVSA
jgi:hypothetical protein